MHLDTDKKRKNGKKTTFKSDQMFCGDLQSYKVLIFDLLCWENQAGHNNINANKKLRQRG